MYNVYYKVTKLQIVSNVHNNVIYTYVQRVVVGMGNFKIITLFVQQVYDENEPRARESETLHYLYNSSIVIDVQINAYT